MRLHRRWAALALLGILAGCASDAARNDRAAEPEDLLVVAPHPDDEILGCAGILRQAIARGKRVRVVLLTNGDGFPGATALVTRKPASELAPEDFVALARYRQTQSQTAFRTLGGRPEDLVFLGYPDSALAQVYQARSATPVVQKFTRRSETYGPAQRDYHSTVHGRPAPYTADAVLGDLAELIRTFKPGRICVTSEADRHPDHQAAFRLVRDAARSVSFAGIFETTLIHGGPEWPWPLGITPESPFEAHDVKGERIPLGVPWPPPRRVALSGEEARLKLAAIRAHATHLEGATEASFRHEREYLESFAKSEEIFWPAPLR